jgi:hypothetical protein
VATGTAVPLEAAAGAPSTNPTPATLPLVSRRGIGSASQPTNKLVAISTANSDEFPHQRMGFSSVANRRADRVNMPHIHPTHPSCSQPAAISTR